MRRVLTAQGANAAIALFALGTFTAPTAAQTPSDDWQFVAVVYRYFPQLTGAVTFPTGMTPSITVDPHQIISNLKFAAFEAPKGPWGAFTDLMYLDASGSKSATRSLSLTGLMIPANITADAHLDLKSTVWTLAGSYRVVA